MLPFGERARYRRRSGMFALWIVLLVFVIVGAVLLFGGRYYGTHTKTVTVLDKERVCDSDSDGHRSCKYLVYTDDTTYRITDSLVIGRFNSSDVYGRVKRCHRYSIEYYGWRIGFMSEYPNIKDLTDLGRVESCES